MRKWIALLLTLAVLSLCSCGKEPHANDTVAPGQEDTPADHTVTAAPEEAAPEYRIVKVYVSGVLREGGDSATENGDWQLPGIWTCTYDAAGNRLTKIHETDGTTDREYIWTYDQNGNKLTEDVSQDGKSFWRTVWAYDTTGKCLTETNYTEEEMTREVVYTYHDNGKKASAAVEFGNDSSNMKYGYDTYDTEGRLIKTESLDADRNLLVCCEYICTYDEAGRVLSREEIRDNGQSVVSGKASWTYNEQGNILTEDGASYLLTNTYAPDGETLVSTTKTVGGSAVITTAYAYDTAGDLQHTVYDYSYNGSLVEHYEITRDLDSAGRLLQETKISTDAEGMTVTEYTTTRTYHTNGQKRSSVKDMLEKTYTWEYDEHGNLVKYTVLYKDRPAYPFTLEFEFEEY